MKSVLMAVLGAALFAVGFAQTPSPTLRTDTGLVSGVAGADGVVAYEGIPYAAPPVGPLRWRPPQPPASWPGVLAATDPGPACMQHVSHSRLPWTAPFMHQGAVSEDCLHLNVWTAAAANAHRPVIVYIYGGGFNEGSDAVAVYNGDHLARRGVVVVNFNYRVGALGFLAYPGLTAESAHHVSGNYGLLDQIAALRWVHRNIAAFGGDPANVTIDGQSAGALSVADLMQSPLARGRFARAIAESGPGLFGGGPSPTLAQREQAGVRFALSKGAHSLAELRALPAKDLIASGFSPFADGWVLPHRPARAQVPLIVGMNADDLGIGGFGPPPANTVAAYDAAAAKKYGADAAAFLKLYPVTSDADVAAMRKTAARDQARVGLYLWALGQSQLSRRVYTYYFSRPTPWPQHPEFGAFHTSEVPYVYENLGLADHPYTSLDYRISAQISSYWINFARRGHPDGSGLPVWRPVRAGVERTMQLGAEMGSMPLAVTPARIAFQRAYLRRLAALRRRSRAGSRAHHS